MRFLPRGTQQKCFLRHCGGQTYRTKDHEKKGNHAVVTYSMLVLREANLLIPGLEAK
jgi:hypothetical protein